MEVINSSSLTAKEHPLIRELVDLIDETVGPGVPYLHHIQQQPFMKFWKNLFIYKYLSSINDFEVVFFGTEVVTYFGMDPTGKLLSDIGLKEAYASVYEANMRVIKGERRVYSSGTLTWQNKEHRKWHHVKMPIIRNGDEIEVLSCITHI